MWSPLARGRLARAWDDAKATARSGNDGFADMLYTPQIDDAVASLDLTLSAGETGALEAPYTSRRDFQGICGDAGLQAIMDRIPSSPARADHGARELAPDWRR